MLIDPFSDEFPVNVVTTTRSREIVAMIVGDDQPTRFARNMANLFAPRGFVPDYNSEFNDEQSRHLTAIEDDETGVPPMLLTVLEMMGIEDDDLNQIFEDGKGNFKVPFHRPLGEFVGYDPFFADIHVDLQTGLSRVVGFGTEGSNGIDLWAEHRAETKGFSLISGLEVGYMQKFNLGEMISDRFTPWLEDRFGDALALNFPLAQNPMEVDTAASMCLPLKDYPRYSFKLHFKSKRPRTIEVVLTTSETNQTEVKINPLNGALFRWSDQYFISSALLLIYKLSASQPVDSVTDITVEYDAELRQITYEPGAFDGNTDTLA